MPIDGLDRPELRIGNEPPLGLAVGRREKHIRRHRHDKRLGFDPAQCRPQVAIGVAANVAALAISMPCTADRLDPLR